MPHIMTSQELRAWLRLSLEPDLGPVRGRALLARFGLPEQIYAASPTALRSVIPKPLAQQLHLPLPAQQAQRLEQALHWLDEPRHRLLTLADADYPPALLDMPDPPLVLYAMGRLDLLRRPCLAMVGARGATPGGMANAHQFARRLAALGWTIVSGLAQGIDAAAHQGALSPGKRGGNTIAVLGTGMDKTYPSCHHALLQRIAAEGLVLSELAPGTPVRRHHFPRRNRLVAGLAAGVLVVEAGRHSGALITARLAGEMGRDVLAIPGSIHSPLSRGCHALIRDGAALVETLEDIRAALAGQWPAPGPLAGITAEETRSGAESSRRPENLLCRTVLANLGHDPLHPDALIARSGLSARHVATALGRLEADGCVQRLDDGCYQQV
ncbi:MAG: DNA-processing protein DprA [Castellaniella sp.]